MAGTEESASTVGSKKDGDGGVGVEKAALIAAVVLWFFLGVFVATVDCKEVEPTPINPVPMVTHSPKPKPIKNRAIHETSRSKQRLSSPSKRYANDLVSAAQMACLLPLWERESGWSPTSDNPTSSAYGIPQILGLKARTGDDYRAQVRAGLDYISNRYGSPCRAWAFWQNHGWY